MGKILLPGIILLALAIGLVASGQPAAAQTVPPTPVPSSSATSPAGQSVVGPYSLTGKTLSNPYCYQPDPAVDQCYLNARFYNVSDNGTTSPYLGYVLVSVNSKTRVRLNTFFENSISYNYDMAPGGLKVPCGAPNAGGQGTSFGYTYYLKVEPFDTNNSSMGWDQALIACPAFAP